ncbi:alpha amylase [Candidatus Koribacter versatilis Ellin345]|uniref:Alpha amylase n=1 Tax=Koribacter versatilis (strain Ellin345) TaxID=204669 RepID=Q1IRJ6_KORVE|nr:alpha-amylase family glycosyl hydrolase [Candidatus Koribacter versatilis]ABF40504.1 alpha amylase [Candidatus Koribacter versatilis Ellin345]
MCRLSRLVAYLLFSCALFAQAPKISKVDPPNWWANYPHSPMLLLTGENLANAKVSANYPHLKITKSESSADGRYVFVYLDEQKDLKPGTAHFSVQTAGGNTALDFVFDKRPSLEGRAQGLNASDTIYLIMPDRFADGDPSNNDPQNAKGHYDRAKQMAYHGGDLKGVTDHLDYLHDLGVSTVWLTPWWKNDGNSADYHGYHVTDFYGIEDHFGNMKDLQQMVSAAHGKGMKVLMDYVVNHTGPFHPWAEHPPTPTWLHGTPAKHPQPKYNFWPLVDPHGTQADRTPVLEGWFVDRLPDLNVDDPKLTEYLIDNGLWWMETASLDGYRLDTFPYSSREFWSKWHKALFEVYPRTFTIGEVSDGDPAVVSFFQGGRKEYDGIDSGVTTVFDFPTMYAIRDVLIRQQPASKLQEVLEHDALYPNPAVLVPFIGNHDKPRFMGEKGATVPELNAAASLLLTLRGIPQLYAGDEIAMPGGEDPDNRRDFPGGFAGDPQNAFTASGRTPEQQEAFAHLQKLLQLRKQHKALQSGEQTDLFSSEKGFAYYRVSGDDRVLIVLNSGSDAQTIAIPKVQTPLANATSFTALDSAATAQTSGDSVTANVPGMTVAIFQVK